MVREHLSGAQKAAVLLAQVDGSHVERVLRLLTESEIIILMNELAQLPMLDQATIHAVVTEFAGSMASILSAGQGGRDVAKALLTETFGAQQAEQLFAHVVGGSAGPAGSLWFLNELDASVVAGVLSEEHPQVIALVLTHLAPSFAAEVMQHLEPATRTDLARRVARMKKVEPEAVATVVATLDLTFPPPAGHLVMQLAVG